MELQPLGQHLHGRDDQDVHAVQPEEVRALPHGPVLVPAAVQGGDIGPPLGVGAAEEDHGPAPVPGAAAHNGVKAVPDCPGRHGGVRFVGSRVCGY